MVRHNHRPTDGVAAYLLTPEESRGFREIDLVETPIAFPAGLDRLPAVEFPEDDALDSSRASRPAVIGVGLLESGLLFRRISRILRGRI